jgi:hypothetical protein
LHERLRIDWVDLCPNSKLSTPVNCFEATHGTHDGQGRVGGPQISQNRFSMSDREGNSGLPPVDDDLSLPKATVAKMITGRLDAFRLGEAVC